MDQALNSQKTPHTSPLRASYGMSFVSILMKNDRVIKGFYCSFCCCSIVPFEFVHLLQIYVNYEKRITVSFKARAASNSTICFSTHQSMFGIRYPSRIERKAPAILRTKKQLEVSPENIYVNITLLCKTK